MRAPTLACAHATDRGGIDAAKLSHMAGEPLRVLLIQSWVIRGEVRDVLKAAGYAPQIYRADFESALVAALPRNAYDVVILDGRSSGLARATVEAHMRGIGVCVPLVEIVPGRDLGSEVRAALAATRN